MNDRSSSLGPFSNADAVVFFSALQQAKQQSLPSLRQTHALLVAGGLLAQPHLLARLIARYVHLGDLPAARSLFQAASIASSFLFNTMARACADAGHFSATLELYSSMRRAGVAPNNYTFPFVLKACSSGPAGPAVHGEMLKAGFSANPHAQAALLSMYAKLGAIGHARKVFDEMLERDLVSWTALITACEQSSEPGEALLLFGRMRRDSRIAAADRVTAISVASAIGQLGDSAAAAALHAYSIRGGFLDGDVTVGNAILSMHAKCGGVDLARKLFEEMPQRDLITWNSMLSGYAQNGCSGETMALFGVMLSRGPPAAANSVTFLAAASACSQLGSLGMTRQLHTLIILSGSAKRDKGELRNAVMDMYAKCGDLDTAAAEFQRRLAAGDGGRSDINCWNVMISGYGLHGHGEEALQLFRRMADEGVLPDHITLTVLLAACSHAGLVEEGKQIFKEMAEKLGVRPMAKHYACMVDMLGRAGQLEEAKEMIAGMAAPPSDAVWGALLGGCRIHGNREMAELAAGEVLGLDPGHGGYYVLMSNVYAAATDWARAGRVREAMQSRGLRKVAGFSVVELGRDVQGFYTGDQGHPERAEIHRKAAALAAEAAALGYRPDTSCVLQDVEEEDKEVLLVLHSEKLAMAYAAMRLGAAAAPPPTQSPVIRISMNLRMCRDCHGAFKALSVLGGWRIVLRDANRFHHFAGGACSCKDYW